MHPLWQAREPTRRRRRAREHERAMCDGKAEERAHPSPPSTSFFPFFFSGAFSCVLPSFCLSLSIPFPPAHIHNEAGESAGGAKRGEQAETQATQPRPLLLRSLGAPCFRTGEGAVEPAPTPTTRYTPVDCFCMGIDTPKMVEMAPENRAAFRKQRPHSTLSHMGGRRRRIFRPPFDWRFSPFTPPTRPFHPCNAQNLPSPLTGDQAFFGADDLGPGVSLFGRFRERKVIVIAD